MNSAKIKELARSYGADLVGIAPVERFDGLPETSDPRTFAPKTRSVIVVAHRILRGALRGVEEGTNFNTSYGVFGLSWMINHFLNKTIYDLTCAIEREGYEASPVFSKSYSDNKFVPDYKAYAHAAGLGSVGKGGFFLTPEYGHRQRFGFIFTTLELEGDDIIECDFCKDCDACIKACPLSAYGENNVIDEIVCQNCKNGAFQQSEGGDTVDRFAAACGRACMVAVEKKISNRFEEDFRKRSIWALGLDGNPIADDNQLTGGCGPDKFESK